METLSGNGSATGLLRQIGSSKRGGKVYSAARAAALSVEWGADVALASGQLLRPQTQTARARIAHVAGD